MSTSVWQWGQCDWRHFIDKTEVSFYFYKPRQDGPCDFQVSREALTLELSWERTPGFLHFQPVFQTNMLMLWAVSFQIPIKAALDVGDCRGRSIRRGSFWLVTLLNTTFHRCGERRVRCLMLIVLFLVPMRCYWFFFFINQMIKL